MPLRYAPLSRGRISFELAILLPQHLELDILEVTHALISLALALTPRHLDVKVPSESRAHGLNEEQHPNSSPDKASHLPSLTTSVSNLDTLRYSLHVVSRHPSE